MRRNAPLIVIALVLLAGFAGYAVWAGYAGAREGLGWAGLGSAWPYLLAGVATVAVVIVLFARLAVHSARRGYDDRASSGESPGRNLRPR